MSARDTGGTAFPVPSQYSGSDRGMTLRDYFAAKVLQGALADPRVTIEKKGDAAHLARAAYFLADAMLAERAKP